MTNYNFVSKSALLAFTSILLKFFGLLSIVFIQRYFGYEIIGIIALSVSLLSMINIFSDLGLETTHRKIFNSSGINKEISISTFTIIKLTLSFVILICTLIFLYFYRHNKEFFSSDLIFLFIFFTSIRFFIDNIISILKNIYYADLEVSTVSRTRLIFRFFQSLSKIAIAFFGFSAIYLVHLEIFFGLLIVSTLVIFLKNFNFKIPNMEYFRMYFKLSLSITIISIFIPYELPGVFTNSPHSRIINAPLWTLSSEFTCYILVAILAYFKVLKKYNSSLLIYFSLLLFVLTQNVRDPIFESYPSSDLLYFPIRFLGGESTIIFALYFTSGMILNEYKDYLYSNSSLIFFFMRL